jgi:two-component system, OmpR family, sensor histidine kinase QseC
MTESLLRRFLSACERRDFRCARMHSLRGRLFGTLLGIFGCAWIAVGIYVYVQFAQGRTGLLDESLDQVARIALLSMPSDIRHLSGDSYLSLKSGAPIQLGSTGPASFQVWSIARHEIVLRRTGTSSMPLKPDFKDGFGTVWRAGEQWRVYAISDARNEVQVQVGKPTSALSDELKIWLYYALGVSVLALLVVGFALKLVVRWSLKPVVTIQSAMTLRKALDMTPLPDHGLPDEVRPLVESFNRLLRRLEHTLQAERTFLAEAAHELRTPLAVLLTHAQVAQRARNLEEARTALDQLVLGVERSARLSQQLLDSARIDVERHAGEQGPLELADIVAFVTHEFEIMAAQKRQTIALDTEPGVIRGNVDELGILIRNLIDNALRYAGQGCRVAVRCARDANVMRLEVRDDGPGVAEADRERIFDRFYRGVGNSERGSGIGLALVAHIAQSHNASIQTDTGLDGRGFGITVSFPLILY